MFDDGKSTTFYMSLFIGILPAGAVFIPVVTRMLNRLGSRASMQVVSVVAVAFGGLACAPLIEIQPLTFITYAFYRAALYSVFAVRCAEVFGPKAMGTVQMAGVEPVDPTLVCPKRLETCLGR